MVAGKGLWLENISAKRLVVAMLSCLLPICVFAGFTFSANAEYNSAASCVRLKGGL